MRRLALSIVAAAAAALVSSPAHAQVVTVLRPVTTFYAPAPAVTWAAPVAAAPHVVASPVVAAPVTQVVAAPVTQVVASPVVVQSPVVAAPAVPVVTYFRPPVVAWQPVPQVVTRHRPILGGTVSRVRTTWMPVTY